MHLIGNNCHLTCVINLSSFSLWTSHINDKSFSLRYIRATIFNQKNILPIRIWSNWSYGTLLLMASMTCTNGFHQWNKFLLPKRPLLPSFQRGRPFKLNVHPCQRNRERGRPATCSIMWYSCSRLQGATDFKPLEQVMVLSAPFSVFISSFLIFTFSFT